MILLSYTNLSNFLINAIDRLSMGISPDISPALNTECPEQSDLSFVNQCTNRLTQNEQIKI